MPSPVSPLRPRVGIIVLNYHGRDCLVACLNSLKRLAYPEKRVIVVDNASRDGSLEEARKVFPENRYLELAANLGFAGGMNAGLRAALEEGVQYCWLFNNDAQADPAALETLVRVAENEKDAGLFSPRIFRRDGSCWFEKMRLNFWRMRSEHISADPVLRARPWYESPALTGCALLLKRTVLEEIGFLDERYFLYYEDADYSARARAAGFRTLVVPGSRVVHDEQSQASPTKLYHLVYSGLVFFAVHASFWQRLYLGPYVTIRRIKNALDCALGRPGASEVRRAYARFFHHRHGFSSLFLPYLRQLSERPQLDRGA